MRGSHGTKGSAGLLLSVWVLLAPGAASAHRGDTFSPGAASAGDPYFPNAGNGGYDVDHYDLDLVYDPATDELVGEATITARATQNLSRFNFDFDGLTVDSIKVDGRRTSWERNGGELSITPARGIRNHARFVAVVRYHGVPLTLPDFGVSGFIHTADGALVAGEPRVASTWFPANDHPRDAASFSFDITVPADVEAIANGHLVGQRTRHGRTTWSWEAREPMATYLATMAIGKYTIMSHRDNGIRFLDAIATDLFLPPFQPVDGAAMAISGQDDASYKRITRELTIPASGALLTFWVRRDTEFFFDYFFVEARPAGSDDWTTLPDLDGFAAPDVGSCAIFFTHPQIQHYMTFDFGAPPDQPACTPTGLTGEWWAATGEGNGWEQWRVDLSRYAGQVVEVSLAYASDDIVQEDGVEIDAISVSTGGGTTSFENGDTGGWQVPGAPPAGSVNDNDWFVGTADDLPPTLGEKATSVLEREGEFLSFLASVYGEYPFRDAGAIVHAVDVGFALENQTRPTYPGGVFTFDGTSTVVHELAHQWVGDLVRVDGWQHIWLNEGFATYAEWLWAEHEGTLTTDDFFDFYYNFFPDDHPFWQLVVADPGPVQMFNFPVYGRGAMTLHRLRRTVGDDAFFTILRQWPRVHCDEGRTGTTSEFIALAEMVSGMDLGDLFQAWLFTPAKPAVPAAVEGLRLVSPAAMTADPRFRLLRTADHVRR